MKIKHLRAIVENTVSEEDGAGSINQFISTLMLSVMVTHQMHLQTKSYAAHVALGKYYAGMPDLIDALAEAYQGKYDTVMSYPTSYSNNATDPAAYISNLKNYVSSTRQSLPQDPELQNEIDNIANLINTTSYLLTLS